MTGTGRGTARTTARLATLLALLALAVPRAHAAQAVIDRTPGEPGARRPMRDGGAGFERRARMEQALREQLARTVRERLALTDEQAVRLREVNRRFAQERVRILREEFRTRRELRQALGPVDSTRPPETARLLDALLDLQRQRLDVQRREQQALAEFLSPEQRARYLALMDELRRRVQARVDSAPRGGPGALRGPRD
jgi:Spy/CpxP family protein refolding chaperone